MTLGEHKSLHWKGKHHSKETIKKISESKQGRNHPMYGKHLLKETIEKISESKRGKNNPMYGKPSTMKGKRHSKETIEKLRKIMKGYNHPNRKLIMAEYQIFSSIKKASEVSNNRRRWTRLGKSY